ncbi:MAG TPA: Maf family protein [Candidatus Pacearchaeota archaeon]|nr:Maf family protein [Candidatus Pacearchaeota archaeon]HPR79772.1 Maf family protein [Candidatus Pacearchaeota archaeon]
MKKIVLASTSPRRKEILLKTGLSFDIQESNYEEDMNLQMSPGELSEYLSLGKAKSVTDKNNDAIVIAADTFVVYNNKCLGKPKTEVLAREMLNMLNGRENNIITGVTIIDTSNNHMVSFHETTKVFMKKMSPETIEAYIKTGEPLERAGGYSIQDMGAILIEKIDGDFFNAMGLPINRLAEELKNFGIKIL